MTASPVGRPVQRTVAGAVGGMAAAGITTIGGAMLHARDYRLSFSRVPALPDGFGRGTVIRVLNVSDIHLMARQTKKRDFLASLADLNPDAVFFTGDQLSEPAALPALLDAIEPLLRLPGAFVFGSHDYHAPLWKNPLSYIIPSLAPDENRKPDLLPYRAMRQAFEEAGWLNLNNRRGTLTIGGTPVSLVGVNDPHMHEDRFPAPVDDAPSGLRIGLTHAPYIRVLNEMHADGAHLVLAGHTHGGQVCLPGGRAIVTNCDLDSRHGSGVFTWPPLGPEREDDTWVAISRGLGTSPYSPFRLFCGPEVQVLDLVTWL